MKASLIAVIALTGIPFTPGLFAQSAEVATSPSPAQAAPTANKIIYAARLPTPQELAAAAATQGLSVQSIEQTGAAITVVYDLGKGQTNTVSYQLLPGAGASTAPATVVATPPAPAPDTTAPATPATPTVVYTQPPAPTTAAPTVIYTQAPTTQVIYTPVPTPVYYSAPAYPYYPYGYGYGPSRVVIGVGFGGGYHHGWGGRHH